MSMTTCSRCGVEYDELTAHTCVSLATEPVGEPVAGDRPANIPPAAPYLPSMSSDGSASGNAGAENNGVASDDSPTAQEIPPMPMYPPQGQGYYSPENYEPRYVRKIVWLNVLWGFLGTVAISAASYGVLGLIALVVAPIVCGIRISKAPDARSRSIAMGLMLGVLSVPVIAFGVCIALFTTPFVFGAVAE